MYNIIIVNTNRFREMYFTGEVNPWPESEQRYSRRHAAVPELLSAVQL
jgi:hypothetical protein